MANRQKRLQDKVVVITGGNRGLGLASAKRFVEEGAKIAIFARDKERNARALKELQDLGGEAIVVSGSVTNIADIESLIAETVKRFGGIDVLFVNHGIVENLDFLDITEEIYDRMMDTNAKGPFFVVQKAVPHMKPGSSVVLCTSSSVHMSLADMMHYTASKQALDSFRRTMSKALLGRGIRVNAVCPGMMLTEMTANNKADPAEAEAYNAGLRQFIPLGRGSQPEEVAEAALFLASDASSYMLGGEIIMDGGVSMVR